jgi:tRNA pseudouridine55 synthase
MSAVNGRSGILLVDKPQGITSHDAVSRTRKAAGTKKVGHAGTLDPMATGLLVLGINSATRLLTFVVGLDKEYLATIRLGSSTTTDDAEGEPVEVASAASVASISAAAAETDLHNFLGTINQVPSSVSAIKVDGKRAYTLARAGETVELAPRSVTISTIELLGSRAGDGFLDLDVRVECSSGTYIRAIARDLGAALGVGGHLTALRRTRIGPFSVDDAIGTQDMDVASALISPADAAARLFPTWHLTTSQAVDLGNGKRIALTIDPAPDGLIAAVDPLGHLVGLVERNGALAKTVANFPRDDPAEAAGTAPVESAQ